MENNIPKPKTHSTFSTKFKRMWKEQPLVPIGVMTTIGFLLAGLRSMRAGNKAQSQLMMRGRVFAQGFTLIAMLVAYQSLNSSKINQSVPTQPPNQPNIENSNPQ